MIIRSFSVLALVLSGLSCPSLAEAHDLRNHLHNLSIAVHSGGEVTPLGSFTLDDIEDDPIREFPWQVSLSFDGDDGNLDFTVTILDTTTEIQETVAFYFEEIKPAPDDGDLDFILVNVPGGDNSARFGGGPHIKVFHGNNSYRGDDGDLDLFLVNAPGGDNSVRFSGVISAVHVPEPSTFAFGLIAALFVPLGAKGLQRRSGL